MNVLKESKIYSRTNVLKESKIYDRTNVLKESKIYGCISVLRESNIRKYDNIYVLKERSKVGSCWVELSGVELSCNGVVELGQVK